MMRERENSPPRAEELMLRYMDGELSAAEVEELDRILKEEPAKRAVFAEMLIQSAHLFEIGREADGEQQGVGRSATVAAALASRQAEKRRRLPRSITGGTLALAAAAAAVIVTTVLLMNTADKTDTDGREAAAVAAGQTSLPPAPQYPRPQDALFPPVPQSPAAQQEEPALETSSVPAAPAPEIPAGQPEPPPAAVDETSPHDAAEPLLPEPEETVRPAGYFAFISGNVYYRRAGAQKWFKAIEGAYLNPGDSAASKFGRTIVYLHAGVAVYLNRNTELTLTESGITLVHGEVYCDVSTAMKPLEIATADA
ncbi:MAG TPA: hypothetical protein ENN09_04340, partial [Planctomycetes bacterium]|nr:hypothetical protein [Planctomycetota bacterium]